MRSFYKKLEVPIYGKQIHLAYYKNNKLATKALHKRNIQIEVSEQDLDAGAISIMDFSDKHFQGILIITDKYPLTHGLISHEVLHIVNELLKYVGMKKTNGSEEAYSYLQEYIVDIITETFKSKGIKII